jgi:hypothetical protein
MNWGRSAKGLQMQRLTERIGNLIRSPRSPKVLRVFAFALLAAAFASSMAQACWIRVERPRFLGELEHLNKILEEGRYADLQAQILAAGGVDATAISALLSEKFPGGFSDCYTIVQRREVGGMEQTISNFVSGNSSIFIHWVTALEGHLLTVFSLSLGYDLRTSLAGLR